MFAGLHAHYLGRRAWTEVWRYVPGLGRRKVAEFGRDMQIVLAGNVLPGDGGQVVTTSLAKLLPDPFTFDAID